MKTGTSYWGNKSGEFNRLSRYAPVNDGIIMAEKDFLLGHNRGGLYRVHPHKTVTITLLANKPTLPFFGAHLPEKLIVLSAAWDLSLSLCVESILPPRLRNGAKAHPDCG